MAYERYCNETLRVIVLQTILDTKPQFKSCLAITADTEGTVCLNGKMPNRQERAAVTELARGVSGVTNVFCNLALKA